MTTRFEDATALAAAIAAGETSALEAFEAAASRFEALNPALGAIIHPRLEEAHQQAAEFTASNKSVSRKPAPLAGVPIAVKDLGCEQAGEPHHRGSKFLAEAGWLGRQNSHLFELLSAAGAITIGRTNTPEFGTTITTEPVAYGPTANPWSLDHSAGGSSGGSAAAVAAGIVPLAHGNDGGGSIRIPASACGLVGLKPTRGRVSVGPQHGEHRGGVAVDGMLTRTVRDAALCLSLISTPAVGDPLPPTPALGSLEELTRPPKPLRVATYAQECSAPVADAVNGAAQMLSQLGHEIVPDTCPPDWFESEMLEQLTVVRTVALAAELAFWSQQLERPITETDVEPANWWAAELGRTLSGATYLQAQDNLAAWRRRVASFWCEFDLLLTPVLGDVTPRLGFLSDPTSGQQRLRELLGFVDQANVSGQPAISLPTATDPDGLPIGVQLIGAAGDETLLLRVAQQVSDADGFIALPDFATMLQL